MDIKAIMFDFGGTLDTNGVHWSELFWQIYNEYNIAISKKDLDEAYVYADMKIYEIKDIKSFNIYQIILQSLFHQFKYLVEKGKIFKLAPSLLWRMSNRTYDIVWENLIKRKALLLELKANFKLAIVSNFYGNLTDVCSEFGYDKLFDVIIDSGIVGIRKPDPDIFILAFNNLGVKSTETIMIGDSYDRDIIPSKKLSCTTIWLEGRSWYKPVRTDFADFIISNLEDLRFIINHSKFIKDKK
jgi:HAD superfamily hydrolase (TIGR01549 family)